MRHFIAEYKSKGNLFSGTLYIKAEDHKRAMLEFFDWIEFQPVWNHLWRIDVELKEIQSAEDK